MLQYSYLCHDNKPDNKADNRKTGVLLSASFFNSDRRHQWFLLFLRILKGINDRADVFACSSVESCCFVFIELSFPCLELLFLLLETVVPKAWHSCAIVLARLCHYVGTTVLPVWHNCFDWLSWAKWALKKYKEKERIFKLQDLSLGNGLTIKRLFFYCQPYYQVLLSWYKRLFRRCLNTKSWQMTIECPKNSLCRSNSDPLISLYEIGDQSEIPVVFSLFLSVRFWMMNEELAALSRCKVILRSSFFMSTKSKSPYATETQAVPAYDGQATSGWISAVRWR